MALVRRVHRRLIGGLASTLALILIAAPASATAPAEMLEGSEHLPSNVLLVADPGAKKVYFYHVPDLTRTGELGDVTLGSAESPAHGGTVALPDGRVLMNDEAAQRTLAVRLDRQGRPSIVNSVSSNLGTEAPWTAVDSDFRYYAVASNTGVVNLIDLRTFRNTQLKARVRKPTEDVHPYLAGEPPTLYLANGGLIEGFSVADVIDGLSNTPIATAVVGPGIHGHFISPRTRTLGITTGTEPTRNGLGLDLLSCDDDDCSRLGDRTTVPWDVSGGSGGRCFRPRMGFDGAHVLCPIVRADQGAAWSSTIQDFHVTDLRSRTARRINVGQGSSSRGSPTSSRYTAFVLIHPRGDPRGDELKLIDVRPASANFVRVVGTAHLPQMSHGPVAGQALASFENRFAAITPDGRYAFATQGGDGVVSMVDTTTLKVTGVSVPTPLHLGGYITAFQVGYQSPELMGR